MTGNLGLLCSFALAAVAGLALTMATFIESFHSARLAVVLFVLILMHLMRFQKVFISREATLFAVFIGYMLLQLLWTPDVRLAMNTLVPATSGLLCMILFGSLVTYHNIKVVLAGIFGGFVSGAITYTLTAGFPFSYPADFAYNGIASMYLFGLIITMLLGCRSRSTPIFVIIGTVIFLHIVATTSIKTNLGMLIGGLGVALVYFPHFTKIIRKNAILLITFVGGFAYLVLSNSALVAALQRGTDRIVLGLKILQMRGDVPGYSAMSSRDTWMADGLTGWARNPVFGSGVEAFRSQYGITSHSTPIDLLHNSGLIGFVLFYSIFVSIGARLYILKKESVEVSNIVLFAALLCYIFISLSGNIHTNSFLAAFVAIGAALLAKQQVRLAAEH